MPDKHQTPDKNIFLTPEESDSFLKKKEYDVCSELAVLLVGLELFCAANRRRYQRGRRLRLLEELNSADILFVQDGIIFKEKESTFPFCAGKLKYSKIAFNFDDASVEQITNGVWTAFIEQTRHYNLSQHCSLKKASLYAIGDVVSMACPEFDKTESVRSYLVAEKGAELLKLKNCVWLLNEVRRCETDDDLFAFIERRKKGAYGFGKDTFFLCEKEESSFLNYTSHQKGKTSLVKGLLFSQSLFLASSITCFISGNIFNKPILKTIGYSFLGATIGSFGASEIFRRKHFEQQVRRFKKNNFVCEIIKSVGFEKIDDETFFCEKVKRLTPKEIARVNSGCLREIVALMDCVEPQTDLELSQLIFNHFLTINRVEGQVIHFMKDGATLEEAARSFGLKSVYSTLNYLSQSRFLVQNKTNDMNKLRSDFVFSYNVLQEFIRTSQNQQEDMRLDEASIGLANNLSQSELTRTRRIVLLKNKSLHPKTTKMLMRFNGD